MGALEDSPEEVQTEIDGDTDVIGDECLIIPFSGNRVETVEKDDQAEENQGRRAEIWLEGRSEGQGLAIDTLCLEGIVEAEVRSVDADPSEKSGDGGQVLEPGNLLVRIER